MIGELKEKNMKKIIELKLMILAKMILKKYDPEIIGVTGSVGKTSTKEAIFTVLSSKKNVRRNIKNYNNEIGLPLTIIGADSPGRNVFGWIGVFFKAIKMIVKTDVDYPEFLVLEIGVDHPGDMDYLMDIVKPKIGVITTIGTVHVEYFGTQAKLRQEKAKLIKNVAKDGWAIINYDNIESRKIIGESKVKVLSFGFDEKAQVQAKELSFSFDSKGNKRNLQGISFKLSYNGASAPVLLLNALSEAGVYSALAAAGVALTYGYNLIEISEALRNMASPKGRTNLIEGIKRTCIIDDTYNAEPESVHLAIGILKRIPVPEGALRWAILGDMLELGSLSEEMHLNIGKYLVKCGIDRLILVGERALKIGHGASEIGMSSDFIFHFSDSAEAGRFAKERIKKGDTILVKGSQGMRMEKAVKEIMANPTRAEELLVRQDDSWLIK